jgi:hypothetical protein
MLVAAWRWQWLASEERDSNICMQSSLASILIESNDRGVMQRDNMRVINGDDSNSLIKMSNEDIALCESIVRAEEWIQINEKTEEEKILKKLQVDYQNFFSANLKLNS